MRSRTARIGALRPMSRLSAAFSVPFAPATSAMDLERAKRMAAPSLVLANSS
jgi:hypothetical protein